MSDPAEPAPSDGEPLRVLQVIGGGLVGGMETVAALLAAELVRGGHDSSLLVLGPDGPNAEAARRAGVRVTVLGMPLGRPRGPGDVRRLATGLVRAAAIVLRGRFDVVQTHLYRTAALVTPLARARRRPVVGALHGLDPSLRQRRAMRAVVERQDACVCVSEGLRRALVDGDDYPADRLVVVPNGVPASVDAAWELHGRRTESRLAVGCIGRLYPRKGQGRLLEAFAEIASDVPGAELVLVGGGPDLDVLRHRAEAAGIADRVRLVGEQPDVDLWLRTFDVLAVPSDFEGFGLVIVEAQRAGVPVVSCAPGGPEDLIEDGVTGRQVPPAELAGALREALTDPEARRSWAEAARAPAAAYTPEAMAAGYVRLYRRLVATPGGGDPGRAGSRSG